MNKQGKQSGKLQDLGESEMRIWHPNKNKDHLYIASLNVQDLVLLVAFNWYLAISLQQTAGGIASKV